MAASQSSDLLPNSRSSAPGDRHVVTDWSLEAAIDMATLSDEIEGPVKSPSASPERPSGSKRSRTEDSSGEPSGTETAVAARYEKATLEYALHDAGKGSVQLHYIQRACELFASKSKNKLFKNIAINLAVDCYNIMLREANEREELEAIFERFEEFKEAIHVNAQFEEFKELNQSTTPKAPRGSAADQSEEEDHYCEFCQIWLRLTIQWENHLKGQKHQKTMRRLREAAEPQPEP